MSYANIWSKVPHTMESTLTLLNNLITNSIIITPIEISHLTGVSSNIQVQLNNKLSSIGGTISGDLTITGSISLPTASTTITFSDSSVQSTAYTTGKMQN